MPPAMTFEEVQSRVDAAKQALTGCPWCGNQPTLDTFESGVGTVEEDFTKFVRYQCVCGASRVLQVSATHERTALEISRAMFAADKSPDWNSVVTLAAEPDLRVLWNTRVSTTPSATTAKG